jgi:hypothetical protein
MDYLLAETTIIRGVFQRPDNLPVAKTKMTTNLVVNWTRGIDQKTGKPLECDPSKDIQVYASVGNLNPNEPPKNV